METVLSFSSIKEFSKSPAHFLSYKSGARIESAAMRFGTAVHMSVLESDKFKQTYEVTDLRKNTKAYKLMVSENVGKVYLNKSDWRSIKAIQSNIAVHELARDLIYNADRFEELITGSIKGVPFRGFADAIGSNYVLDLKTTQSGSPEDFKKSAYNFKYYLQAAIYSELTGMHDFWIVTAESSAPYNVTPYLVSKEYIQKGKVELYALIESYKKWRNNDNIIQNNGYDYSIDSQSFFTLDPPKWVK